MSFAHETIYDLVETKGKGFDQDEAVAIIKAKYPWINSKNMNHAISQGLYYAFKDGLQW